jgi:hypothetical protein
VSDNVEKRFKTGDDDDDDDDDGNAASRLENSQNDNPVKY